jgi:tight adherence protein B
VVALILLGASLSAVLFIAGARQLVALSSSRRDVVAAVMGEAEFARLSALERWDRVFRRTRLGQRLERELVLAGVAHRPITMLLAGVAVTVAVSSLLWTALAPVFGVLGLLSGVVAVRGHLSRGRGRRREAFIAQMPELARVLANATNAGLSIATAIGIAGDELDEPARAEMQRVATSMAFGNSLERALEEVRDRLPSRETAVLVSTLVVSARSGGSLVTALRDIADTLEGRKETRREIRTTLAQALATGYLVMAMGVGLLFMLNAIQPGTVQAMVSHPLGQLALLASGALFGGGFLIIRRMTRIEP